MAQPTPSFKAQPRKPRLKLPPGATDTHFHVFGPQARFPFAPERTYTPTCDAQNRNSREPAPWPDAVPFARKLVADFGDRALWGSDWPHPNLAVVPDDGDLVDLIAEIAPTEAARQRLLVDNPRRLYGFAA